MKRKKLSCLILVAAMLVSMIGCATPALPGEETGAVESKQESVAASAEESTEEGDESTSVDGVAEQDFNGVNLRVWVADQNPNTEFKEYFEANSGMTMDVIFADDIKLMSMIASGTAPDVWFIPGFGSGAMFAARGLLEPLDDYIAKSEVFDEDDFVDAANLFRWDGKEVGKGTLYGIPRDWSLDNQFWINKKVFEDAGIPIPDSKTTYSYDDIMEWAKKCVEYDEDGTQIRWGFGSTNDLMQLITAMLASQGLSLIDNDSGKVNVDTPEVRAAFEYWKEMYSSKAAISDISTPGDWGGNSLTVDKVGMVCCGYWFGSQLANDELAKVRLEDFELIQAPSVDPSKPSDACLTGYGVAIWKGSKNKDAAFRLMEMYLGGEWGKQLARSGRGNPGSKRFVEYMPQETEFQKQAFDANKYGMEHMITVQTCPYVTPQGLSSIFQQYFYETLYDRMTLDDAIAGMQSELEIMVQEGKEICGVE